MKLSRPGFGPAGREIKNINKTLLTPSVLDTIVQKVNENEITNSKDVGAACGAAQPVARHQEDARLMQRARLGDGVASASSDLLQTCCPRLQEWMTANGILPSERLEFMPGEISRPWFTRMRWTPTGEQRDTALSTKFNSFYRKYPIMNEKDEAERQRRAICAEVFRRTMVGALELLGIPVPERM